MSGFFTKLFKRYNRYTERNPLTSISISTGVILTMGDVIEQAIERRKNVNQQFSLQRMLNMGFYGFALYGPFCCYWYTKWLPKLAPLSSKPTFKELGIKILYDETLESSIFYLSFLYTMTRLEGGSHDEGTHKIKRDFLRCYLADLTIWPIIQFANFRFAAPHLQPIIVASLTVLWGAYISYVQHS